MSELWQLTLHEAQAGLDAGSFSAVELTRACFERIAQVEDRVKAYVTLTESHALQQAEAADQALAAGQCGPMTGIPVQIKDLICTKGIPTTCSSKMLENFVPVYDATVSEKLFGQGRYCSARATWTNLPWAPPAKTPPSFPPTTPGT